MAKRKPTAKQLAWRKKFAAMAKAGKLRKKKRTTKRKTANRNPSFKAKRKAVKRAPIRAKRAASTYRKAKGRKKTLTASQKATSVAVKRNPSKFLIRGVQKKRNGYDYYYLTPKDHFSSDIRKSKRFTTRAKTTAKMREIQHKLPFAIDSITCVRL